MVSVFIDGRTVSLPPSFVSRHPGGSQILERFSNRDATEEFYVIHPPSAIRTMEHYALEKSESPSIAPCTSAVDLEMRKLRVELQRRGELVPLLPSSFLQKKCTMSFTVGICGHVLAFYYKKWFAASFFFGLFFCCIGTVSHDIGHMHRRQVGTLLKLIPGIILGASLKWWNYRHWAHHMHPNEDSDPDAVLSFAAWNNRQMKAKLNDGLSQGRRLRRLFFKNQHYFFYAILLLLRPAYTLSSFYLGTNAERLCLSIHVLIFYIAPVLWGGAPVVFIFASHALGGFLSGLIVTANHYQEMSDEFEPTVVAAEQGGYYARQLKNTAGFAPSESSLLRLFYGSLDEHIEHHCFPRADPSTLREIAPRVEAICLAKGAPYNRSSTLWDIHVGLFEKLRTVAAAVD